MHDPAEYNPSVSISLSFFPCFAIVSRTSNTPSVSIRMPSRTTSTSYKSAYHALDDEKDNMLEDGGDRSPVWTRARHRYGGLLDSPTWTAAAASAATLVIFAAGFILGTMGTYRNALNGPSSDFEPPLSTYSSSHSDLTSPPLHTVFDAFRALPPIDYYREYGLNTTAEHLYPEPLGKKILIVNVDTRPFEATKTSDMTKYMWGAFQHYIYAQIHGYDYQYIKVPPIEGLQNTWVKVYESLRLTRKEEYQFVVMTDADIIFPDLRLPLEPLFSHWNITPEITLAAALDPGDLHNADLFGRTQINTGFVVTQRTPDFENLFKDWIECPTGVKYSNCTQFTTTWAHEQSALSSFIRYDYEDTIREIDFWDANAIGGKFVKHPWFQKTNLDILVKQTILDRFVQESWHELRMTWHNHVLDGRLDLWDVPEGLNQTGDVKPKTFGVASGSAPAQVGDVKDKTPEPVKAEAPKPEAPQSGASQQEAPKPVNPKPQAPKPQAAKQNLPETKVPQPDELANAAVPVVEKPNPPNQPSRPTKEEWVSS